MKGKSIWRAVSLVGAILLGWAVNGSAWASPGFEKRSAVPAGDAAGVASPNVLAAMPVPDALAATFAGPKPQAPLTMDRSGAQGLLAGGPINVLLAMADDGT
ncbi:MAG: hypothetical protein AB1347_05625, partial [Acidobacteriota bacterium]